MVTTKTDTICKWGPCYKLVYPHVPWYPYCSNEHEQMAVVEQRRQEQPKPKTVPVQQLGLESSLPWRPEVFALGTAENVMHTWFEGHPNEHIQREQLVDLVRQSLRKASRRDVMSGIMELRRAGWPIIASSGESGYWYSTDPADWDKLEQNLRGRSMSMLRTLSRIRRARAMTGRVPLDDVIDKMERGEL